MEATGVAMSDFMEILNPQTMTAKLLQNGVVVEEYKIEQCDKCSMLTRFDAFGYQKGYGNEKIIWFCAGCR
jgi:MinD superfamily P-loop ATPase